uniref:Uncharacterized protein n=1 Tax=Craspedostauros australis TaxID=1486917 RepID=A0A7R9WYS2_9STRA|mmetsp:Transcript_23929/g.66879  ORF Transcript_23929/g.66879 Transcript_23929/m.66879 type:complete len:263 (+) Transcript_23929:124-912(+)
MPSSKKQQQRRFDGRPNAGTLRPLSCELSCLANADGSALWKSGSTHVLAAVQGPIVPMSANLPNDDPSNIVSVILKSGEESSMLMTATTSDTTTSSSSVMLEAEWQNLLTNVFSSALDVPSLSKRVAGAARIKIQIVFHIIQSNGSTVSCLLHAGVAALMDAGIDLLYMPIATTCLVATSVRLDPTSEEECEDNTTLVVMVHRSTGHYACCGSHVVGGRGLTMQQYQRCHQLAKKACPAVVAFWRLMVEHKVKHQAETLWSQ